MYRTTLYNLSEDLEHASAAFGQRDLGEINAEEMHSLLEFLRHIDPVELHDAQPYITVSTALGRFTIRASSGKLHLYDVANPALGSCELEPTALIHQITPKFERRQQGEEPIDFQNTRRRSRTNQGIAICMLLAGLLLNGYTLYAAFYIDDVHRAPPLTLVTDPVENQRLRDTLAGHYATGTTLGDRELILSADGSAELLVVGPKSRPRQRTSTTYSLGRRDGKIYLQLKPHGQIEVASQKQIMLWGDTYRRLP